MCRSEYNMFNFTEWATGPAKLYTNKRAEKLSIISNVCKRRQQIIIIVLSHLKVSQGFRAQG